MLEVGELGDDHTYTKFAELIKPRIFGIVLVVRIGMQGS